MKIGITSTIPIEIPISAGLCPLDLNNLFITSSDPKRYISFAESEGLPQSVCAWIKGIYGVAIIEGIECIIPVTGGDCSNSIALAELLLRKNKKIFPFEFPLDKSREMLQRQFENLINAFDTNWEMVLSTYEFLNKIRAMLGEIDRLTYEEGLVSGYENHLFLVSASDFEGDPKRFQLKVEEFISRCKKRSPFKEEIRLGYVGVPPIFHDLYQVVENFGARVVFNEIQRQFSLPFHETHILDAYLKYTYPYGIKDRLQDIKDQIKIRQIDGIIHYVQNFCYRQLYDIILREELEIPILTLEGNEPGPLDKRSLLRIEGFFEMLRDQKVLWV